MKAVGFFLAVFTSMLAVFLVATGEVSNWFSSDASLTSVELPPDPMPSGTKNILEFPFWEVKEGRLRFRIRAELSQESFQGTDAIKELQEISLKDGFIEVPFYAKRAEHLTAPTDAEQLEELLLEFESAVYRRGDGLASGKKPLFVHLRNGKGTTNEGTQFLFEELLFFQNEKDKGQFQIETDKPITIVREPYLKVYSPSGLTGLFEGHGGFRSLLFRPPVYTYLDPRALDLFSQKTPGSGEETAPAEQAESRRVAISCTGPLELAFAAEPLRKPAETPEGTESADGTPKQTRTRITLQKDVVVYELAEGTPEDNPPPRDGNRFECQKLELEIEDSEDNKPAPSYARATWDGGRVQGFFVRANETYLLDSDRLEWVHSPAEISATGAKFEREVILSGDPTLRSKDRDKTFRADRAVWKPEENRLRLEDVTGVLQRPAARENEPRKWNFRADDVSVAFSDEDGTNRKVLSHFVATSQDPHGVVIEAPKKDGPSPGSGGKTPNLAEQGFLVAGEHLTFREKAGDQPEQVTLEGAGRALPRLSSGRNWIEADRIHLFRKEEYTRFEGKVRAHIEPEPSDIASPGNPGEKPEKEPAFPESEIRASSLQANFEEADGVRRLASASARGNATEPVKLDTLDEPRYRLRAPELRLDAVQKRVELLEGPPESSVQDLSKIEFDGGEIRAKKIRFDQGTWTCQLEDDVDVRLYSSSKDRTEQSALQISASRADIVLTEDFQRRPTAARGALGQFEQQIRELHAVGKEGSPLSVSGKNFTMRGEDVTWSSEKKELRFSKGEQKIEVQHDDLHGPITSREIIYDQNKDLVTLLGSVRGQLRQPAVSRAGPRTPGQKASPPLTWEFETSELDLEISDQVAPDAVELVRLKARNKILLRNRQYGLKLVGDDLVYEHRERRIRVFSRDGRLQKLVHFRPKPGYSEEAQERDGSADQILAREIWVFHYPGTPGHAASSRTGPLILVQFEKVVDASFHVRGDRPETWKIDTADSLTLHVNPTVDVATPQVVSRAVASGNVVFTSDAYRAEADRAEYEEAGRQITLFGKPVVLVDSRHNRQKNADTVTIRKVGDKIVVNTENPSRSR